MRKAIVLALALALLAGISAAPAAAKRKKEPEPPPITFEDTGRFATTNITKESGTLPFIYWGVTGTEFHETCAIPATQGFDGYVVELSDEISKVSAKVSLRWGSAGDVSNLYMAFFDADCEYTGIAGFGIGGYDVTDISDDGAEKGAFEAGTKYVLVSGTLGADVSFALKAVEIR